MRHLLLSLLLGACGATPAPTDAQAAPQATTPAAPSSSSSDVAATVNGEPIPMSAVDAEAGAEIMKKRQEMYEVRMSALEQMIAAKLFAAEAGKRGVTEDALLKAEVEAKAAVPAEADILALYEQSKPRLGGATLEDVRGKITAFLEQRNRGERMQAFLEELKAASNVKVMLDPPRFEVEIPAGAPTKGSASAPITIVEFSDFECPYCSRAAATVDEVTAKYGDKVRIVFRNFPLDFHRNAKKAAEAALCAHESGKFWEFHDKLFANQDALGEGQLVSYAKDLGLDAGAFETCLSSGKHGATVSLDQAAGQRVGVEGTPGFFVNGRFVGGAQPFEAFAKLIDEELARTN
ncbi:MAG: DsbA family protein [Alphaproteobacteria bacterium]|nr:DsbA family protein [Alphaproteobacteria bacterium]